MNKQVAIGLPVVTEYKYQVQLLGPAMQFTSTAVKELEYTTPVSCLLSPVSCLLSPVSPSTLYCTCSFPKVHHYCRL